MAVFLTSGNPLGLRALGSGGRSAANSYEQIARTLRQSFGADHAALFAEPNARASVVDWFANIESGATPVRLVDAPVEAAQNGLARLETLARDIEAKIVSLQKSDRQDERILGEMLAHGLEFPDESAVFLVGTQPVITFWGYVPDKGRPAVSPLRSLLLRRRAIEHADLPLGQGDLAGGPGSGSESAPNRQTVERPKGAFAMSLPADKRWLLPTALWTTLALLVLTCAAEMVRGCAIGLPEAWSPSACVASPKASFDDLAAEQAKQDRLRADLDTLVRQASIERKACPVKTRQTEAIPPIDPPISKPEPVIDPPQPDPVIVKEGDKLQIPDKETDTFDFLAGCWKAHQDLTETKDGKETGKKLDYHYCFNRDGSGATTIRYREDGAKCSAPLRASLSDHVLRIVFDKAICEGTHGHFSAGTATCRRGDAGAAVCDEYSEHKTKPDFVNFPFIRAGDVP